ncbi:hypothetical protein TRAPUB_8588 [Trametes pubescens]|uniref:Uncharacterized protein n=1 Tax=Trametes pubescens TaxID=154538 RepID=A0A1M2W4P9_TRAPU|nr:hypothetical protein TRAPUB_8588 [Trametes pubescens]
MSMRARVTSAPKAYLAGVPLARVEHAQRGRLLKLDNVPYRKPKFAALAGQVRVSRAHHRHSGPTRTL